MASHKQFKLTTALVTLVMFGTLLCACSERSLDGLAVAASATRTGSDDSTVTVTATATPSLNPTVERELEVKGAIQAISGSSITINGQTFTVSPEVLAQLGSQLKVGTNVELKTMVINGVSTVVRLEVEDLPGTATPRPTTTAMPSPGATATPDDDQNDDKVIGGQGKGKDDTQPDNKGKSGQDQGNDDNTRTPTVEPAKTPRPASTIAPTTKSGSSNSGKGSNDKVDDKTKFATASPTKPATAKPQPTEVGDDKGKDKVEDKTKSPVIAAPTPAPRSTEAGAGDDKGSKGNGDDKTKSPTPKPTEKATSTPRPTEKATSTPRPTEVGDDSSGKGGGSGSGKGGK